MNRFGLWSARVKAGLKLMLLGARMFGPPSCIPRTSVATRELRRVRVFNTLLSELTFKHDAVIESNLHRLTRKIDQIYNPEHQIPASFADESRPPILRQLLADFAFVAGEIARWELEVKLFAEVVGIKVAKQKAPKSKQNLIDFYDLGVVIDEVRRLTPGLKLNLVRLRRIRNNFNHGNLYSASKLMTAQMSIKNREKYKAGVTVVSFADQFEPITLDLSMAALEASRFQTFAWMLEAVTSGICEEILKEFHLSLDRLAALSNFRSWCNPENQHLFNLVCVNGEKLSVEDIEELIACNSHTPRQIIEQSLSILEAIRRPQGLSRK